MSDIRFSPFANGSQFMDWDERNCCHCTKSSHDASCEIDYALLVASLSDGTVSETIAKRMGYLDDNGEERALDYTWPCTEFVREVQP